MNAKQTGVTGGILGGVIGSVLALPWCCIVPTVFSVLGLAGASVAREATVALTPYLLAVSILFLGRAHYLLYVRHQGNGISHIVIWASTVLVLTLIGLR